MTEPTRAERGRHRAPPGKAVTGPAAASRSRRQSLAVAATGLGLIAVAVGFLVFRPLAAPAGSSVSDAGSIAAAVSTSSRPAVSSGSPSVELPGTSTAASLDGASTGGTASPSPVPTSSAPAPAIAAPGSVSFPGLEVSAVVVPVGVDEDGAMEVPADVATVGWYRFGPAPGAATGSAVLTGHVDTADQGRGVFADLELLEPGDPVEVTDADGTVRRFQVVARESWPKDEVPLDRLFDRTGSGRLVLITCGGAFDPDARSYEQNIAVTAVPVDG